VAGLNFHPTARAPRALVHHLLLLSYDLLTPLYILAFFLLSWTGIVHCSGKGAGCAFVLSGVGVLVPLQATARGSAATNLLEETSSKVWERGSVGA
jgi:hypothetical protein